MYYDLLARIKNGFLARKDTVYAPYSNFDFAVASVLEKVGFVERIAKKVMGKRTMLEVKLKYAEGRPAMSDFKIESKPSRRLYRGHKELKPVKQNYGIAVLSTPAGVLAGKDARKKKVGGEYLFEIW